MNSFKDLLMHRKSIRKYKDRPVEKEKVEAIVEAALTAPTGHNTRAWEVIVVDDRKKLEELSQARGFHSRFIKDAPLGFVVAIDPKEAVTWRADAAIIASYIQLMGQSLGLGSCWIESEDVVADDGSDMEENIKKTLGLPAGLRVLCMISMGYSDQLRRPHNKEKFKYEKIHYNRFGN